MPVVKKETKEKSVTKKKVTKKVTKQVEKVVNKVESKKATSKEKEKVGIFKKIGIFFHEVKKEMSYVKWPGKKEMFKYSSATILFILFFAAFFYLIELVIAALKMWV